MPKLSAHETDGAELRVLLYEGIGKGTERNVIRTEGSALSIREVGKLKALTHTCAILVFLLSLSAIAPVLANIPTVLNVEAAKDGADTVLSIEISHSSPSSTH